MAVCDWGFRGRGGCAGLRGGCAAACGRGGAGGKRGEGREGRGHPHGTPAARRGAEEVAGGADVRARVRGGVGEDFYGTYQY